MNSQKKQVIFVLNSNELDGPSRFIYELSLALKNQFVVTVYVPIIPRYKLFVLQSCKNLGWLASLAKQIHYCFRWLTIDLVIRKLKWVKDIEGSVESKRCIFSPPQTSLKTADYVILSAWYHTLHFPQFWESNKEKFVVCHWHYEDYRNRSIAGVRDKIVNGCQSITCSENSSNSISSKRLRKPHVVSMGINPNIFHPIRRNYKTQDRSIDIVLYRGFEKRKGFHIGLEAMQNISENFQLNCCVIQGSKRAKTPWDYPVHAELSDEKLAQLLRDTNIFLYPSLLEGFGMPPLEAMACGCAVVTTRVGAVPDYTTHMVDAYVVDPGQVSQLEHAITFLLNNRDAMQKMQAKAADKAASYSWRTAALNLTDVLNV